VPVATLIKVYQHSNQHSNQHIFSRAV